MAKPKNKKMAAALAAVNAYLQQEAEAAYLEQQAAAANAAQAGPNLWAISGRQEMMTMRRMMQLRAF